MIRTVVRARRAALAAVGSMVLVVGLGACSSGSGPDDEDSDAPPGADGEPAGIRTTATMGKVTGKLDRDHRAPLRQKVTTAFDSWVDSAYLSAGGADAFGAFTKDAAALAKRDRGMSNADGVEATATGRKLTIDVLADRGRPVGITGRFVLVFELGDEASRTDRIVGRLLMRRGDGGWKIFGYDVKRGKVA